MMGEERIKLLKEAASSALDAGRLEALILGECIEEIERLRAALEDFANHGVRTDLNPTKIMTARDRDVPWQKWDDNEAWWHEYIASMDERVRDRAREALGGHR